jgi:hypothetical protein
MGFMPQVQLTGKADKVMWIYGAFFALIALAAIFFLGKTTGQKQAVTPVVGEKVNTSKLTYDNSQYLTFADSLHTALKTIFGLGIGEDTETVYGIMKKMKTDDDVKQVIGAFGLKSQEFYFTGTGLAAWMTNALDSEEIQKVNSILAASNIKYSF